MGNVVVSALKVINCDTCAKYVCNACKVNSKCVKSANKYNI